ncbi:MAG: acetyltransferase family protein [Chitinophagaceae bacterium]|nr:acetyltransferase family protein [Chitinophagaceae bacterium]
MVLHLTLLYAYLIYHDNLPMPIADIEQITPELTWRLRRDVLYPGEYKHNMGMPEDEHGTHFGAFADGKLVGVVSLFHEGGNFQFRKFAIDPSVQQQGIGRQLLQYITDQAAENGATRLWCNARSTATGFYAKAGFTETGDTFSKNGFEYVIMEKLLISDIGGSISDLG